MAFAVETASSCGSVRHRRRRGWLIFGTALAGCGLLGTGAFASWDATTSMNSGSLNAASVAVQMVDANAASFTTGVSALLPGDYFYRYVDLQNLGTTANTFTGQVTATGDLGSAMLAQVDVCSTSWTSPAGVSTCSGTTSSLLAEQSIAAATTVNYGAITSGVGNAEHVRYRFKLNDSAPAALMGKTAAIALTVSGTAVGGRDRTGS